MDKITREKYKELGLCVTCGEPAVDGKRMCAIHLDKRRKYAAERRKLKVCNSCGGTNEVGGFCKECWKKIRDRKKQLMQDKKERGECTTCANRASQGKVQCDICRSKSSDSANKRKAIRREKGLCENCGTSKSGKSHLCSTCCAKEISCREFGTVNLANSLIELLKSQGGVCPYTKIKLTIGDNASIDHRIPRSKGGTDDLSNLQWVYLGDDLDVNRIKFNMTEDQFKDAIKLLAEVMLGIVCRQHNFV